ncbi:MAG: extracellular solute-binding protein [Clostridia bacterium]|nr:extracellular solute-binding protein [Clostridia bacterium]
MKKFLAILLAAMMLLAMIPAAVAEETPEPWTVTVFRGDPGDQPTDDNKIYKMIEEQFGIKFEFEFLAGNLDETLGLKIADEVYPDLFDGGNSAETLENAGVLIDLLPYISEEKTPNLYKHIYTDDRIKQLTNEDGELFIIPNYGINYNDQIQNYCNGPAFFIQKQVIAWNNYQVPTTLNEYFDLIERFLAENPTTADGTPYQGFAILCEGWRHFCLINPVQHLMGRPNDGEVMIDVTTPEYKTETFIDKPYAKAYYAKLNEEFHKGLISKDTFVMNYDQYIAALSNGTVLGMFDQTWDFGTATQSLETSNMYANTYLALPLVYDPEYVDGKTIEEHYLNGSVMNKDRGFGISTSCKDPERLVQLMEALLSDEWQTILQWGIEGEDYTVDENGRMLKTREQYMNRSDAQWKRANMATAIWESMPKKQGTMDNGNAWDPANQPEIYFDQMSDYDKEFLSAAGKKTPAEFFNPPIELAPYGEAWQIDKAPIDIDYNDFLAIQDRWLPTIITCDPAELDANWDAFVAEITPSAQVYTDFMQAEVLKLVEAATN